MLYWLSNYLQEFYHGFGVFQYITLRAVLAALTALVISVVFGPPDYKTFSQSSDWTSSA